jgi:hypothetical protein
MRHLLLVIAVTTVAVAAVLSTLSATPQAQWLHYPTPGVPMTAAGSPDLMAPAPRTADGKPDLSGTWDIEHNRPCPPGGCLDFFIGEEFVNIGWSLKNGLPYQPWARDLVRDRSEQNGKDDPVSHCLPPGVVKTHTTPLLRKIIQVPGLVVVLSEMDAHYRQIFTDGRPLPSDIDLPSANGFSTGKWEGDTLVVQTTGFRDGLWLDRSGSPMTDAARMTERFRRVNYGKMEIEVTVDDPKAYTAPWTVKMNSFIVLDTELIDYICMENEKDVPRLIGK